MKLTGRQILTNYYSSDSLSGEYREQFARVRAAVRITGGLCAGILVALIVALRSHPLIVLGFMTVALVGLISLRVWEYQTFYKLLAADRDTKYVGAVKDLGELKEASRGNK